jgi:translocation and assembly module TamB
LIGDKKISIKSIIIQLLFFTILVLVSIVLFKPLKKEMDIRLEQVKGEIIHLIESNLQRKIAYSGISPSFLQTIVIRDLQILDNEGTESLITINKLRIRYNLLDILFNRPAQAVRTIYIENSHLNLDVEEDEDIIELGRRLLFPPGTEQSEPGASALDITLAANNLTLNISTPLGRFKVTRLFFRFDPKEDHFDVKVRNNIEIELVEELYNLSTISSSIQFSGEIDKGFNWIDIRAHFDALQSNIFQVKEQRFHITFENSRLELRKIEDKLPIDLLIAYQLREELATIEFKTENFFASDIVTLTSHLKDMNPWLTTMVTADGLCEIDFSTGGDIYYQTAIEALIENELTPDSYYVKGEVEGDMENIQCRDILVSFSRGIVEFSGNIPFTTFYPTGTLGLKEFKIDERLRVNTVMEIRGLEEQINIATRRVDLAGEMIFDLDAVVFPQSLPLHFLTSFSLPGGNNRVNIDGTFNIQNMREFQAELELENVPSPKLYSLAKLMYPDFALPESNIFLKHYNLSAAGRLKTDFYAYEFDMPSFFIQEIGEENRNMNFSAAGNNKSTTFQDIQLFWNDLELKGALDIGFGPRGRIKLLSTLGYMDNEYTLEGTYDPAERLVIHGSYGLTAYIDLSLEDSYPYTIEAEKIPLNINEKQTRVTVRSSGFFKDLEHWQIDLANLEIIDFPFLPAEIPLTETYLSAEGVITPQRVGFSYLEFSDSVSTLQGSGSGDYDLANRAIKHGSIALKGDGNESYMADFSIGKDLFDISIEFKETPLERFAVKIIRGELSGTLAISGSPESPDVRLDFNVDNGFLGNDAIEVSGRGSLIEDEIQLSAFDMRFLNNVLSQSRASYNLYTGTASFYAEYNSSFRQKPINFDLSLNAEIKETITRENLFNLAFADFTAQMYFDGLEVSGIENQIWLIDIVRESEVVKVAGGPENSILATVHPDGSFSMTLRDPMPIACEAEGFIKDQIIEAELNKIDLSLESIAILINLGYVEFRKGNAEGGLRIVGPVNDPDIFGTISIKDVTAGVPLTQDEIGPVKMSLFFEGKTMNIRKLKIPAGGREATVSGAFILDHWMPHDFQLNISAGSEEGIHIYQLLGPLFADGIATGDVTITQSGTHTEVTGDVTIQSCSVTLGEEVYYASSDKDYSYSIDLTVTTGKRVEFFWPSETVPVLRTTVEPGNDVKIYYDNTFEDYAIQGDIEIRGGEIFYFDRNFYIREGKIGFNEDQDSFDPTLTVRSELRETWQDEPVRIYLTADENKFSKFEPRFESDPPMDNITLFSILGQSIVAQLGGEALDVTSALVFTGDLITQFGFIRTVEQSLRDTLNLDLFTLRSPVFQNVMQSIVSDSAYPLDNNTPSLGKYLDKTTVLLGKYLGTDLFLELMVQLSALEPYEYELRRVRGIDVYSELSLEWKTPFFLMEWSFFPSHPENLFLTDNRLSLSWKYSY